MSRTPAFAFAALLALNAAVGTLALTRTLHLGQASHRASGALVAKRTPPPLPKMPTASVSGSTSISAATTATAPRVRFVRPAPIIIHKHRSGGEHEAGDALGDGGAADD